MTSVETNQYEEHGCLFAGHLAVVRYSDDAATGFNAVWGVGGLLDQLQSAKNLVMQQYGLSAKDLQPRMRLGIPDLVVDISGLESKVENGECEWISA